MNIFEEYLKLIKNLILNNQKNLKVKNLNEFKGVVVEIPPANFDYDLSCNISLILAKINKIDPKSLAKEVEILMKKNLKEFSKIEVAGPGFLNIKLSNEALIRNINIILENKKIYGKKKFKQ